MKREQRASIVRARGSKTLSFQIFEATKRDVYLDSRVVSHELGGVEPLRLFSVRPVLVIQQVFQLLYSSLIGCCCRRERERERERERRMHLVSLRAERTRSSAFFLRSDLKNEDDDAFSKSRARELERKKSARHRHRRRHRASCRPVSSPIRVSGGPLPCSRAASFLLLLLLLLLCFFLSFFCLSLSSSSSSFFFVVFITTSLFVESRLIKERASNYY